MFQFQNINDYINTLDRLRIALAKRVNERKKEPKKVFPDTLAIDLDNADIIMITLLEEMTNLSIKVENPNNINKFVTLDSIQGFLSDIELLTIRLKYNN